jgi:VIT1/CCC1 family predicted Fe2+/Mn2+ transporter
MATSAKGGKISGGSSSGNRGRFSKIRLNFSVLLREAIFGINDGLVSTIGLVSGEVLAGQPRSAIIIAGMSAVGAAVVSMSVGSYLATSSQNDWTDQQVKVQQSDIQRHPRQEAEEVEDLLLEIGIPDKAVGSIQRTIIASQPRWLKFMVRESLGVHPSHEESPLANALTMAVAVVIGSSPPIVPFLVPLSTLWARDLAWVATGCAALIIGALKGHFTGSPLIKSSLQFGILASLSAGVGAGIGWGLGLIGALSGPGVTTQWPE